MRGLSIIFAVSLIFGFAGIVFAQPQLTPEQMQAYERVMSKDLKTLELDVAQLRVALEKQIAALKSITGALDEAAQKAAQTAFQEAQETLDLAEAAVGFDLMALRIDQQSIRAGERRFLERIQQRAQETLGITPETITQLQGKGYTLSEILIANGLAKASKQLPEAILAMKGAEKAKKGWVEIARTLGIKPQDLQGLRFFGGGLRAPGEPRRRPGGERGPAASETKGTEKQK